MTSIGNSALNGCTNITSIKLPSNVTIGEYAFAGCSNLESVTFGDIIGRIEGSAFNLCAKLKKLNGLGWQSGCKYYIVDNYLIDDETSTLIIGTSLKDLPSYSNLIKHIGDFAFCNKTLVEEDNIDLVIPYGIETIGSYAFCAVPIKSVSIPSTVTKIDDWAFGHTAIGGYICKELNAVYINELQSWFNIDFGHSTSSPLFFAKNLYLNGELLDEIEIPDNVRNIKDYALAGWNGEKITIPNSVTSIGEHSFSECSELLDVYCYAENVPSTESDAFSSSPIADATLHVPAASIDNYKATAPWSGFGTITSISGTVTPLPNLTLTDGEEYENNIEQEVGTLTYTRTLPNMLWNPLYVPFKIPYEDLQENYEVAYINAMHSYDNDDNGEIDDMVMEIVKIKAGTLKPNHPYLIMAKTTEAMEMSIVQENTTLYPSEITTLDCSSVYTKFEIAGTYQKMTSEDLNGSLVISTDGVWKKLSSTSTLKPFRFYLTISSRDGSPVEIAEEAMSRVRIKVMGEDDNVTGVDELKVENVNLKTVTYDLSGRRVSTQTKGGVYIINGKSVIY